MAVKPTGGGGRGGRGGGGGGALARMMPEENRKDLNIPAGGGLLSGEKVRQIAYNPKTDTLVAGAASHANLIHDYAPKESYDSFVKVYYLSIRGEPTLTFDVARILGRDDATKWDTAFRAARALRSAGIPHNTKVQLAFGQKGARMDLGEI